MYVFHTTINISIKDVNLKRLRKHSFYRLFEMMQRSDWDVLITEAMQIADCVTGNHGESASVLRSSSRPGRLGVGWLWRLNKHPGKLEEDRLSWTWVAPSCRLALGRMKGERGEEILLQKTSVLGVASLLDVSCFSRTSHWWYTGKHPGSNRGLELHPWSLLSCSSCLLGWAAPGPSCCPGHRWH